MKNRVPEIFGVLLIATLQIFGASNMWVVAGEAKVASKDAITTTVEVAADIRRILPTAKMDVAAYLTTYPTLVVKVEPDEPHNFVVAINGTPYQAGAKMFRVVEGTAMIVVTRSGKQPCKATLKVTKGGPNEIECQM